MNVAVIIVAAGAGNRLGCAVPKAFVEVAGVPMLRRALDGALACPQVAHVVLVVPDTHLGEAAGLVRQDESSRVDIVAGGAERPASVARGMALLRADDALVLVHDAARCLTPPEQFSAVIEALRAGHTAVIPGLPVVDTVKEIDQLGRVVATPQRARLRAIQTPQGFDRETLARAYASAGPDAAVTDDAALVERIGAPVLVIDGDDRAVKITTAQDLERAARLATAR